jgi:ribokinase
MSSVCVIGSLNMDLVVRAPRIPTPGETVLGGAYRAFPGGKGANQAVAAARMGARVTILGSVGDDPHGVKMRAALEPENLDLSKLITRVGEATGLALITVADGGENTIVVAPGANAGLSVSEIEASRGAVESADVLLMQLEVPMAVVVAGARIAREAGRAVILNAAPARTLPPDLLKIVDVLVVNRTEAAILLGMDSTADAARLAIRLPELGVPTVILTQGAHGAIVAHRGRPRRVPAMSVQSVDSVGAGDAFCGALAAGWSLVHGAMKAKSADEFRLVEEAVNRAAAAGALATTKPGAMPSMPRAEEVDALMQKGR